MPLGLCTNKNIQLSEKERIESNFQDLHPALNLQQAQLEADHCLYCFDAPCINACPTSIDIPTFIHQIRTDNVLGSAKTILSENIMAGTCARACPTEILCEQACVLNESVARPVKIGELQRYAVDHLLAKDLPHPFSRAATSGKTIAVIGAGPAGLACAHRAAMLGHSVKVFESKLKSAGLNEYGLAAYKMVDDFAQKEVAFLLEVGGIEIEHGKSLNSNLQLSDLTDEFDAVFIGVGLYDSNSLGIEGDDLEQVVNANDFIEKIRQTDDKASIQVGQNVVVIGAGNTAIDAAIQSKRLGAENVTLVYRRGEEQASATPWELDLARQNEVKLIFWAAPKKVSSTDSNAKVTFQKTQLENNKLIYTDEEFEIESDMVLTAIGQNLEQSILPTIEIQNRKIVVDENYQTSQTSVFAGGDCIDSGEDLTVQAVEDGKQAAIAIDKFLKEGK